MKVGYKLTGAFLIFTLSISGVFYFIGLRIQDEMFTQIALEHVNDTRASFRSLEQRDTTMLMSALEVTIQDPGIMRTYLSLL
jgi:hypothetical protein